jgi:site-specific DNA-methyltransferase (adenine-specific)
VSKLYFSRGTIRLYNDDFLNTDCLEDATIDLIVTSPPYNVDITYNSYDDEISYDQYLAFSEEWLKKAYLLAKSDGRLCLNIPLDINKGGQQSVCADLTTIAKKVGWKYHSTIIWNEQNISRRTAWGSWMSASAPYVIAPVEVIVVLYKERWKKTGTDKKSDITRDEFLAWTNGVWKFGNDTDGKPGKLSSSPVDSPEWTGAIWEFSGASKKKIGHPTPFPVELPKRCIKLFSYIGDTVLDPFVGSGATLLACRQTGRVGIGIDIDEKYCELAVQRLFNEGKINQFMMKVSEKAQEKERMKMPTLVIHAPEHTAKLGAPGFQQILSTGIGPGYAISPKDVSRLPAGSPVILLRKDRNPARAEGWLGKPPVPTNDHTHNGRRRYDVHMVDLKQVPYKPEKLNYYGYAVI